MISLLTVLGGPQRWAAALLALLCCVTCLGCTEDRGTEQPPPVQPTGAERFVGLSEDVVLDTRTRLQWTSRDSNRGVNWHEADDYCRDLTLGGQKDWRLPEIDELLGLYDPSLEQPCGERTCRLDPLVQLTDPYLWSGTQSGSSRRFYVDFQHGTKLAPVIRPKLVRRALCVRQAPP